MLPNPANRLYIYITFVLASFCWQPLAAEFRIHYNIFLFSFTHELHIVQFWCAHRNLAATCSQRFCLQWRKTENFLPPEHGNCSSLTVSSSGLNYKGWMQHMKWIWWDVRPYLYGVAKIHIRHAKCRWKRYRHVERCSFSTHIQFPRQKQGFIIKAKWFFIHVSIWWKKVF